MLKMDGFRKETKGRKKNKEGVMKWFILGIVVSFIIYFLSKWKDRGGNKAKEEYYASGEEKVGEIDSWFENSLADWRRQCIGYKINQMMTELSGSRRAFDKFLEKKGIKRTYFTPEISVPIDLTGKRREKIKSFLKEVEHTIKYPDNPEKDLKEYLMKEAEKEAKSIINEYLKTTRNSA